MIVDDSLSRLTTRVIVHDSFWSAVFPENLRTPSKWPPKVPLEAPLQLQKFVFMFKLMIMTKKTVKPKISICNRMGPRAIKD